MRVGALTRHYQLLEHPLLAKHFPALVDAAGYIGHPTIRRNGSIGGSISHADPTAEWPASAVLSDASIIVRSLHGKRRLAAREFFDSAYVTALEPGELVVAIEFPVPPAKSTGSFVELGERSGDFAIASFGIMIEHDGVEITKASTICSGADLVPIRAPEIEVILIGQPLRAPRAKQAGETFSRMIDPVDDHIASAEYRRNLIAQLTERAILKACSRAVQQP
jgi:carbon-monoxide dehydrogenase medium subunit